MQSGFFDELLKNEKEEVKEEIKQEVKPENSNVETFDFGSFSQNTPNQQVQEEKKVEEKPIISNVEPKIEPTNDFSKEKVEIPTQEIKTQPKPNIENEPKVEQPQKVEPKQQATTNAPVVKKDFNQTLIENTLNKINDIVTYSNETFTPQAKIIACDIITSIDHTLNERGYAWNQIDAKGSGLIMQIKKWAKLGIDCSTDKLYCDIRRNGNTGLYDIKVKGQYQTVEKLMVQYCRKNIIKFKTEVICIGDELKTHFNYETGEERVIDFIKNNSIDRTKYDNMIGAFKIAYYEDNGKIGQIVTIIEKDRIERARGAAMTKNVWNSDTQKMVKKTVTWEMFNGEDIRPFMDYPAELIEDLKIVNENEDIDFNKEHKYQTVESSELSATETLGSGNDVGFDE